jgi:hypothetical protein
VCVCYNYSNLDTDIIIYSCQSKTPLQVTDTCDNILHNVRGYSTTSDHQLCDVTPLKRRSDY